MSFLVEAITFMSDVFRCAIWHQLPCDLPVSIHVNAIRHQLSCALPVSIVSTCGYEVFFRCRFHCIIDVVCHMAPIAVRSTCLHGSISLVDVSFAADSVPYGTNCRALYLHVSSCLMDWWLRHQSIDPHHCQCSNKRMLPFGRMLLCGQSLGKLAPCILVEAGPCGGDRFRGPMRRYMSVNG